jgi:hypothetical protein
MGECLRVKFVESSPRVWFQDILFWFAFLIRVLRWYFRHDGRFAFGFGLKSMD